jgi:Ni,Fe-hydrogenase I small subunit
MAAKLVEVSCKRCGGSGSFSFNLKDGTRCYGCNGSGKNFVDLKKDAAAKKRAAAKKTETNAKHEALRIAANARREARKEKYCNDERLGPITKNTCAQSEQFADQCYTLLEAIDAGTYKHGCKHLSE